MGGVGQTSVEIRQLDDGYEPDRCAENTRKLLAEDAFALFGYIGTPTSMAALPLAIKAETPFFAPFTGAMGLRQPFNRNAFHLRASYNDETALIVRQLTHLGLNKIAVFHQNDAYGKAGLDGVTLALAARSLKPVAAATVERNSVNVAPAVAIINAAMPDAVVQIGAYAACAAYIRAARKAGFGGTFYNVSLVGTQALADALGAQGAGVAWYPRRTAHPKRSRESFWPPSPRAATRCSPTSPAWKASWRPSCLPRALGVPADGSPATA